MNVSKHQFSSEMSRNLNILILSGALFLLAGCMTMQSYSPEEAPEMWVTKDFAPFYSGGPQQMQGPDATLRLEHRMKMLRKEFGYTYVQLEDGRLGFVPNEFIAPATPRPSPTPIPRESNRSSSTSSRDTGNNDYDGPGFDEISLPDLQGIPGDIPPPVFLDDSEDIKKPEFRL